MAEFLSKQGSSATMTKWGTEMNFYDEDRGLRVIAIKNLKCFSFHEPGHAQTCGVCPLARWCKEASEARIEELARALDAADSAPKDLTPQPKDLTPQPEDLTPVPKEIPLESLLEGLRKTKKVTWMQAPFPMYCSGKTCNHEIPEGADLYQIVGLGVFLPQCLPDNAT